MNSKILEDIRAMIGVDTDTVFNTDLLIHINTFLSDITQVGVGPTGGMLVDANTTWSEFITNLQILPQVRTYVYIKVKLMFDTSSMTSYAINALNDQAKELIWRLQVWAESGDV